MSNPRADVRCTPHPSQLPPRGRVGWVVKYAAPVEASTISPAAVVGHLARERALDDVSPVGMTAVAVDVLAHQRGGVADV